MKANRINRTIVPEPKIHWLCAVAKREDGNGFLITAYLTDAIKVGDLIWEKSK